MLKKFGAVAVGVGAGLVAMAPLASAGEAPHDPGHGGHSRSHGHGDPHGHGFAATCDFRGGDADAASDISGDSGAGNIVAQLPAAGNNALNLLDCSSFLNHNVNHNFADNHFAVFGDNAVVD